jgi:acetolactate decarboxylase
VKNNPVPSPSDPPGTVAGSLGMIQPAWHRASGVRDPRAGELYQASLLSALMSGMYEGDVTYGEIARHGDFGLGTFNHLDGEMVALDGTFYQLRSDGSARLVTPDQKTPFAAVMFFYPEQELDVAEPMSKEELVRLLEKATNPELFTAIRVDGLFDEIRTRTAQRQIKPFPPLAQATKNQAEQISTNVEGSLVGFRTPAYAQGIGVAGFHLHFLRQDRQAGGHALDYRFRRGKIQFCTAHDLRLELPTVEQFLEANLEQQRNHHQDANDGDDMDEQIRAIEG